MRHFSAAEWAAIPEAYKGRWEPSPWNLDSIARGKLPAEYLGRRNVIVAGRYGTTLLTEGFHFVVDGEDKKIKGGGHFMLPIKNILDSLRVDVLAGRLTLREAAVELCRAGWTNFVDEETARRLLRLNEADRPAL